MSAKIVFMLRSVLWVGLFACGFIASGCTAVQPWERGDLADYKMRPDRDPLSNLFEEHVYFTREAAAGGRGVGGGGCGCN